MAEDKGKRGKKGKKEVTMPQFTPGLAKVASLSLTVSPSGLNCSAELYLTINGTTVAATSGLVLFVSTGVAQTIQLPITMPSVNGTYLVRIVISSGGSQIGAYQATDNVVIGAPTPTLTLSLVSMPSSIQTSFIPFSQGGPVHYVLVPVVFKITASLPVSGSMLVTFGINAANWVAQGYSMGGNLAQGENIISMPMASAYRPSVGSIVPASGTYNYTLSIVEYIYGNPVVAISRELTGQIYIEVVMP